MRLGLMIGYAAGKIELPLELVQEADRLGVANVIPLSFSAAGRLPGLPAGVGIAGVAAIGYAGFLAGPPVIGLLAEATSLRIAFLVVAVLVGTLFFTAQAINVPKPEAQTVTIPTD